jgi:hypothetical protein
LRPSSNARLPGSRRPSAWTITDLSR